MRNLMLLLICLALCLSTGCNALTQYTDPAKGNDEQDDTEYFMKSSQSRETSPQIDPEKIDSLAKDNTAFALEFYKQIKVGENNIIFSPFSISTALSMTLAGAETSTEQAMINALQLSLPEEEIHPAFNALMLAVEESQQEIIEDAQGNQFQLNIANSIWGQTGYAFKEPFLDTLARYYGSGLYHVDYQNNPDSARELINDWVENETNDKIQDLIPPNAIDFLTRLVLANAIYFNGSWRYPFSKSATYDAPFTKIDGSEISVEMMKLSGEYLGYGKFEHVQVVNLPYLSPDFAMTVVMPDQGNFLDYESELDTEDLEQLLGNLSFEMLELQIPKFDFTTSTDAKKPLKDMGMAEAFDPNIADFSGITDEEKLLITDVLHKAAISVDEEGTEAAAATAVIVGIESSAPVEPISVVIDRPFLFFIRHNPTGTILFMGRVMHP